MHSERSLSLPGTVGQIFCFGHLQKEGQKNQKQTDGKS